MPLAPLRRRELIYLERKSKRGLEVRKRRSSIPLNELNQLDVSLLHAPWPGGWYHAQLQRNSFSPVALLHHDRLAYFGQSERGPIRLTFDRNISGGLTNVWSFTRPAEMRALIPDAVVCELKFRGPLPHLFKAVIQAMQLVSVGVSKYRHCLNAARIPCLSKLTPPQR